MEEYKYLGSFNTNTKYNSLNVFSEIRTLRKQKKVQVLINSGVISTGFININYAKT